MLYFSLEWEEMWYGRAAFVLGLNFITLDHQATLKSWGKKENDTKNKMWLQNEPFQQMPSFSSYYNRHYYCIAGENFGFEAKQIYSAVSYGKIQTHLSWLQFLQLQNEKKHCRVVLFSKFRGRIQYMKFLQQQLPFNRFSLSVKY